MIRLRRSAVFIAGIAFGFVVGGCAVMVLSAEELAKNGPADWVSSIAAVAAFLGALAVLVNEIGARRADEEERRRAQALVRVLRSHGSRSG